jgi:hypothetical protein
VDSSGSQDPRLYRGTPSASTYPYGSTPEDRAAQQAAQAARAAQAAPRRTSSSIYPYEQQAQRPSDPHQPQRQEQPQQPQYAPRQQPRRNPTGRRLLGVLAFLVLTGIGIPLHIGAIFFVYVEFESPGDPVMAALLIGGAFIGSFVALFLTGLLSQLIGGFPGRWRARITFATLAGIISLAVAYLAALKLF